MAEKLTINPWLTMWIRPRQTVRQIVSYNPRHRFLLLSAIYGFPMLLHIAQNLSLGETYSFWVILIASGVLSTIAGVIGLSIASVLLFWTGKWIGGKADYYPVRAAVSWSNVPNVVGIILWLILAFIFQNQLFDEDFTQTPFVGAELGIVTVIFISQTVLSIWSFILLLKGLGEVQGFSAWKGLLNVLIPFFLVGIVIWAISSIFWAAQGMVG